MDIVLQPPVHRVLCADCGDVIEPNSANLCIPCLRNSVDITEGIPKQATIAYCRNCERFLAPPTTWTLAQPESRELLAICLRKLKGLNKVRLIDAGFIWTEPHSKRLRVKLTIQKEVFTNTILQQIFEIEFVVAYGQCPDCTKLAAKNTWNSLVQVRQKVDHKRTFLYLEQLILKHGADKDTVSIKEVKDGLDFFYAQRTHAIKMVEFLAAVVPIRSKTSEQLLSKDTHSGSSTYKFTYSIEIIPICRDDLICIPPKQARSLSNISPLTICTRVGNSIHLLDPSTLQQAEVTGPVYWRTPFDPLASVSELVEFIVLDIEPSGPTRGKYVLADAQVAPARAFRSVKAESNNVSSSGGGKKGKHHGDGMDVDEDAMDVEVDDTTMGGTDAIYHTRTHLGAVLQPGDTVLGYYLSRNNFNSSAFDSLDSGRIPDVILVKKTYPNRRRRTRKRNWKLKSIAMEAEDIDADTTEKEGGKRGEGKGRGALGRRGGLDQKRVERDYEQFLQDLEEDPELRATVNLYRADKPPASGEDHDQEMVAAPAAGGTKKRGGKGKASFAMDAEPTAPVQQEEGEEEEETEGEDEDEDFPEIQIDELLDEFEDLAIRDGAPGPQAVPQEE